MKAMALGMFIFLFAIAVATFLESMYGIQHARIVVYNAKWFETLLLFLGMNLVANIFRYKMFQPAKIAMLMFHVAFIVMLIGAFVTRYFSQEGLMIIKEGETSSHMYSSEPYVWYRINDGEKQYTHQKMAYMSPKTWCNDFNASVDFPGHSSEINMEYVDFHRNMVDSLVTNDSISSVVLNIVTNGMQTNYLTQGGFVMVGENAISFGKKDAMPGIEVSQVGRKIMVRTQLPLRAVSMAAVRNSGGANVDSLTRALPIDTLVPFETSTLYMLGDGSQFVFKEIHRNSDVRKMESPQKNGGVDILTLKLTDGDQEKIIELKGGKEAIPDREVFNFNGLVYEMEYGAIRQELPFSILCRDFQLDNYPGSNSPSSFASEVTVIDDRNNFRKDQRIFMNHVMDYDGYRFFQSSYEPDLSGTRLSVNQDWWGTNISYVGYLMMGIGMLMSLFSTGGRFRELIQLLGKNYDKRKNLNFLFVLALMSSSMIFAQDHDHNHDHDGHDHAAHQHSTVDSAATTETQNVFSEAEYAVVSEEHADKLARLLVQDYTGRIIPMHTFADQVLRKISRSETYAEYNAVQTIFSMHMYPAYWMEQPIIYVSSKGGLRDKLGMQDESRISFADLSNKETGEFIFFDEYSKAHQMREARRGEYEKQLIKLAEKYEVMSSVLRWGYIKILPLEGDAEQRWFSPLSVDARDNIREGFISALSYISAADSAGRGVSNYDMANTRLQRLIDFQYAHGGDVAPSKSNVETEIRYNKMHIFKNAYIMYAFLGFIVLLVFFVRVFVNASDRTVKIFNRISLVLGILIGLVFLYHAYGVYMRAVISGHAPWSNGYEAMVFIAAVAVFFGLFFTKRYPVILAGAAIFASLLIIVTELNLMDPEITPLVPVLKSYWLMIHVAIITGSYAPLGIAFILGLLNIVLYIVRNEKNGKRVTLYINELTYVSEMLMTIGVFMLTIGTFLGGIWANESWGRYWGWDPKETWALVAVLCYAIILHFRYIPGMKSKFVLNVASFWGYSTILFTFFGVNFMLVGLHSYAQGDGMPGFPNWLTITIIIFLGITVFAGIRNKQYKNRLNNGK